MPATIAKIRSCNFVAGMIRKTGILFITLYSIYHYFFPIHFIIQFYRHGSNHTNQKVDPCRLIDSFICRPLRSFAGQLCTRIVSLFVMRFISGKVYQYVMLEKENSRQHRCWPGGSLNRILIITIKIFFKKQIAKPCQLGYAEGTKSIYQNQKLKTIA